MNLQNVDLDHFSLISGWPQDCVMSRKWSVGVANILQCMVERTHKALQVPDTVISCYYLWFTESHSTVRQKRGLKLKVTE